MSSGPSRASAPVAGDPAAERDARRREREDRRGPRLDRPEERSRARHRRQPLAAPVKRGMTLAGVVGIAVAIAAIMSSQGSPGWLIGLVVAVLTLVLAAIKTPPARR